jgi:hypothetical protein
VSIAPVVFRNGTTIICHPGSVIRFANTLSFPDNGDRWKITSSLGYLEQSVSPILAEGRFGRIVIESQASGSVIKNGIVSCSEDGLRINADQVELLEMTFYNSGTAVVNYGQEFLMGKCIVKDCTDRSNYFYGNSIITDNILKGISML